MWIQVFLNTLWKEKNEDNFIFLLSALYQQRVMAALLLPCCAVYRCALCLPCGGARAWRSSAHRETTFVVFLFGFWLLLGLFRASLGEPNKFSGCSMVFLSCWPCATPPFLTQRKTRDSQGSTEEKKRLQGQVKAPGEETSRSYQQSIPPQQNWWADGTDPATMGVLEL